PVLRSMYKQMEHEFVVWLESGERISIDAAITKYIKLAQIQAGFMFREDKSVEWIVPHNKNPRLNALLDYIDDELVGKAIIVYNHKPMRDALTEVLSPRGGVVFIHGNMTDAEISASKHSFNTDRSVRYICITKAAKYGHTLLGNQDTPAD